MTPPGAARTLVDMDLRPLGLLAALLLSPCPGRAGDALGDAAREAASLSERARSIAPRPAAVAVAPEAAAEDEPFISVRLRAAPFRGPDGAATRAKVEEFARRLGRPLRHYQDNDLIIAVTLEPVQPFTGAAFGLADALRRRALARGLDALRLGDRSGGGEGLRLFLKPPLYEDQLRARLAALPEPVTPRFYVNQAMAGEIWIDLRVDGLDDPKAWAARLAAEHPAEVKEAGVYRLVRVLSATSGAGR